MTIAIHCFKGTGPNDTKVFQFDPATTLNSIRTTLTNDGFMPVDDLSDNIGYRFFEYQAKDTKVYSDAIVALDFEYLVPLSKVLGPANQLMITNSLVTHKPDLMGIGVDWWFNRYVGAQVSLNETDASAIAQNQKIGAFPPMMLTNVIPTSKNVTGIFDNVCICVDGTVVNMTSNSWGAAGFAEHISAAAGEPVVDGLFLPYSTGATDHYSSTTFRRWAGAKNTIEIVGTDEVSIAPGKTLSYQKITFKTARMTHWENAAGQSCTSNSTPPPLTAPTLKRSAIAPMAMTEMVAGNADRSIATAKNDAVIVPGGGIKPGTPTHGGPSSQDWGSPISNIKVDPWTSALGEVVVYFFVFRSHADAIATINGINAPDPSIWGN